MYSTDTLISIRIDTISEFSLLTFLLFDPILGKSQGSDQIADVPTANRLRVLVFLTTLVGAAPSNTVELLTILPRVLPDGNLDRGQTDGVNGLLRFSLGIGGHCIYLGYRIGCLRMYLLDGVYEVHSLVMGYCR